VEVLDFEIFAKVFDLMRSPVVKGSYPSHGIPYNMSFKHCMLIDSYKVVEADNA